MNVGPDLHQSLLEWNYGEMSCARRSCARRGKNGAEARSLQQKYELPKTPRDQGVGVGNGNGKLNVGNGVAILPVQAPSAVQAITTGAGSK